MINLKLLDMDVGVPCYSHLQKNGIETIAALGVAATVLGTGATIYATERTNSANRAINQANLDYQENALTRQIDANVDYTKMRSEAEKAGYSPYAFIGGSANNVGLSSAPSQIPMQSPNLQASFDALANKLYDYQKMRSEVNKANSEAGLNVAQTTEQLAKNTYADEQYLWNLAQTRNNAELLGHKSEVERINGVMANASFDARFRKFMLENELMERQIDKVAADTALSTYNAVIAQENAKWIPKINQQQIQESLARIATEVSKRQLNYASAKAQIAHALTEGAQQAKLNVETEQIKKTSDDLARGIYYDTEIKKWQEIDSKNQAMKSYDPWAEQVYNSSDGSFARGYQGFLNFVGHHIKNVSPFKFGK